METTVQNPPANPRRSNRLVVLLGILLFAIFILFGVRGLSHLSHGFIGLPSLIAAFVLLNLGGIKIYCSLLGVDWKKASLLWIGALLGAAGCGFYRGVVPAHHFAHGGPQPLWSLAIPTGLLVLVAVPFVFKLHSKWIGGQLSENEKLPGTKGIRAWLSIGNLMFVLLIAVLSWLSFGCSFFVVLALLVASLLAYPLLSVPATLVAAEKHHSEDVSAERERVLRMLENGKITPEESADLLNALGATVAAESSRHEPLTPARKLVLAGAALVLLGFFLPWFTFNLGTEMNRAMGEMQNVFSGISQNFSATTQTVQPGGIPQIDKMQWKTSDLSVRGGDVPHGVGWVVLAMALGAAALPYLAPRLDRQTQRMIAFLGLGVGAIILIYLATQSFRLVSVGLILAVLGYVCEFIGATKES